MRQNALFLSVLFLLAAGSDASANVGSPLLVMGTLQLIWGNFLIGAIEALVLWLAFRLPYRRGLLLMTLANYSSMLVGLALVRLAALSLARADRSLPMLQSLLAVMIAMWISFYIGTVLLEVPFVYRLFPREKRTWGKVFGGSALAQSVSYLLLIYFYQGVVNYSLLTQTKVQPDLRFTKPLTAHVYYIGLDGNIWRVQINGANRVKVKTATITDRWACLYAKKADRQQKWDLWCVYLARDGGDSQLHRVKLLDGISSRRVPSRAQVYRGVFAATGRALDYRPPSQRAWNVWVYPWPEQGLQVLLGKREKYSVAMGTPLLYWHARAATCLPGDYVVFQLGDCVFILHMPTRQLGLLAAGRCPFVVMPDRDAPDEETSR